MNLAGIGGIPGYFGSRKQIKKAAFADDQVIKELVEKKKRPDLPELNREDRKRTQIYNKFCCGKKLTEEELRYLAQSDPKTYMEVKQVLAQREQLEAEMRKAKSKEEVSSIFMSAVNAVQKSGGNSGMKLAKINQFIDAKNEYMRSHKSTKSITNLVIPELQDTARRQSEGLERLLKSSDRLDEEKADHK